MQFQVNLDSPYPQFICIQKKNDASRYAVSICQQNILTIEQISTWIKQLIEPDRRRPQGRFVWDDFEKHPWRKILTDPIEKLCAYRNIQNFLRAFYFQWKHQNNRVDIKDLVQQEIDRAIAIYRYRFLPIRTGFLS
ncbi:MAG: hypothetical protein WBA77_02045 [Microcoleaceae cyanobacterium]